MKKNNLVLMIVTISIFVVLLIGATYAYFASNANVGNGLDFSVTTDENNIAFTATSGTLSLHVAAENMLQSQIGQGDVIAAEQTGEENITITLSSNTATPIACTYNIYFKWNTNEAYLTPTNASKNEFTLELELQDSDGTGSEGTNKFASETQLTKVITNTNKTLVVEGASIVGSSLDSGSQTWVPTARFYNLTDDQSALAGATFGGKFTIEDVECNAQRTISDTVLAKVSNNDYTSSQDQTVYRVKKETATGPASDATYTKVTNYGTTKIYSATTNYATNGTDASSKFTKAADGTWSNVPTSMTSNTYYHIVLPIEENGYYEVCYNLGAGSISNYLDVYVTDKNNSTSGSGGWIAYASPNNPKSGCTYIGYLTTEEAVRIANRAYTSIASVSFYLQKTNKEETMDAGVRYEGNDPDNYVQFNGNEEWRIIGVFEGSTIGLEPGKQYTKIIRNTSIGYKAWDEYYYNEETVNEEYYNDWTNSTLNTYLNNDYLNGNGQIIKDDINRDVKSLLSTAKSMIAQYNGNYSTWYLLGPTSGSVMADSNAWYFYERTIGTPGYKDGIKGAADAITTGAIGLMYPSDYGYGAYGEGCTSGTTLSNYAILVDEELWKFTGCGSVDWLTLQDTEEWLISPYPYYSDTAYCVDGDEGGGVYAVDIAGYDSGGMVRPVLYLGASVKIAGGSGTKANPYKLS